MSLSQYIPMFEQIAAEAHKRGDASILEYAQKQLSEIRSEVAKDRGMRVAKKWTVAGTGDELARQLADEINAEINAATAAKDRQIAEIAEAVVAVGWNGGPMPEFIKGLAAERDKLNAFKKYVHRRLDEAGVPQQPEPKKHALEGCRVGDRLDCLLAKIAENEKELAVAQGRVNGLMDILENAWAVIANVSGGTWEGAQRTEWIEAAQRVRDAWHNILGPKPDAAAEAKERAGADDEDVIEFPKPRVITHHPYADGLSAGEKRERERWTDAVASLLDTMNLAAIDNAPAATADSQPRINDASTEGSAGVREAAGDHIGDTNEMITNEAKRIADEIGRIRDGAWTRQDVTEAAQGGIDRGHNLALDAVKQQLKKQTSGLLNIDGVLDSLRRAEQRGER